MGKFLPWLNVAGQVLQFLQGCMTSTTHYHLLRFHMSLVKLKVDILKIK